MSASAFRQARAERIIAATRVWLAGFSLFAIWLDPAEPAHFARLTYSLHASYLTYAIVLAAVIWRIGRLPVRLPMWMHVVDIAAFSVFQYLTLGPSSPFFIYFNFSVFCGAIRWGWRGALGTTLAVLVSFVVMGAWMTRTLGWQDFELNRFVIRIGYLSMVGMLLVYLGRHEARLRDEIELLARWPVVGGDRREFIQRLLLHACSVVGAGSAVLVWAQEDEPRVEVASWHGSRFELTRHPAADYEPLVDPAVAARTFLASAGSSTTMVHSATESEMLDVPVERVVNPALAPFLGSATFATAAVRTERLGGRLFVSGLLHPAVDALPVVEIVAREIGSSLDQLEMHARQRQLAIGEERIRVARDLHDGVLQGLTGIRLELQGVARTSDEEARDGTRDRLLALERALAIEQRELRLFIEDLKPFVGPPVSGALAERLEALRQRVSLEWKVPISLRVTAEPPHLPPEVEQAVPRMVHEAIVNALKHGQPSRVAVDVRGEPHRLLVTVSDDGRGFPFVGRFEHDTLVARNLGPGSLCERVASLGGRVTVESGASGARVELDLPIVTAA